MPGGSSEPPCGWLEDKSRRLFATLPPVLFLPFTSSGISALHGGHQVAQKFKSTTLPLKSVKRTVRPLISLKTTGGADRGDWANATAGPTSREKAIRIFLITILEQIPDAQQNVPIITQHQRPSVAHYWQLDAPFDHKLRMSCILQPGCDVVFSALLQVLMPSLWPCLGIQNDSRIKKQSPQGHRTAGQQNVLQNRCSLEVHVPPKPSRSDRLSCNVRRRLSDRLL